MKNILSIFISGFLLCSCYGRLSTEEQCALDAECGGGFKEKQAVKIFANDEDLISLQNLESRVVVHCKTTPTELAETCARAFEKQGFTRFREIPYKTADYDFLKKDTYPTRRWREGEATPRW